VNNFCNAGGFLWILPGDISTNGYSAPLLTAFFTIPVVHGLFLLWGHGYYQGNWTSINNFFEGVRVSSVVV
jgi:hypothetical protein